MAGFAVPESHQARAVRFTDLDDLNAQARAWAAGLAADRRWPEDSRLSVRQALKAKTTRLLALHETAFALGERLAAPVGKTPWCRSRGQGGVVRDCRSMAVRRNTYRGGQ